MSTIQASTRSPLLVSLASLAVFALVACSGAPTPGTSSGSSSGNESTDEDGTTPTDGKKTSSSSSSSSSSSGSTSSSSSSGSTTTTPTVDAAQCKGKDAEACFNCCTANDETAMKPADDAFQACMCGASGACRTQCAKDFCVDPTAQPSQACDDCLAQKGESCDTAAVTACNGDAKCKAAMACLQAACDSGGN